MKNKLFDFGSKNKKDKAKRCRNGEILLMFLCLLLFFSCKKRNTCIEKEINNIKSQDVWNPPAEVWQYRYNGQTVYYIPPRCCDIPSRLLDENCNVICSPDGGFTGKGDGKCNDFFSKRTGKKLIWKDKRIYR